MTYRYNDLMRILQDSRNNYNQLKENIKIATLALAETDNRKSDITAVSSLPVNSPVRKRQLLLKNEY